MEKVPYDARVVDRVMARDSSKAYKVYVLGVAGRGEWTDSRQYHEKVNEIRHSDLDGIGFAFVWPHIPLRMFEWRNGREFVLDEISSIPVTEFKECEGPNVPPLNLERRREIGCSIEIDIYAAENRFWRKSKTTDEYLQKWSRPRPVKWKNYKLV